MIHCHEFMSTKRCLSHIPEGKYETSCEYISEEMRPYRPAGRSQIYVWLQYVYDLSYGYQIQR